MPKEKNESARPKISGKIWISAAAGVAVGFILCAVIMISIMPSMMITTKQCRLGFDETVDQLQKNISDEGWSVKGVRDINQEIRKAGHNFDPKVKLIKLCKAEYAKSVLTTDRYVSCLMPCTVSVWQDDDGKVYLSKMNMSLMARMFGGNIGKVMGGKVAEDEDRMLEGLLEK